MFTFRRNGADPDQYRGDSWVDPAAQVQPAEPMAEGFADRMLRSTLGVSMADMQRVGAQAQEMVGAIQASLDRIDRTTTAMLAQLAEVEERLAAIEARLG